MKSLVKNIIVLLTGAGFGFYIAGSVIGLDRGWIMYGYTALFAMAFWTASFTFSEWKHLFFLSRRQAASADVIIKNLKEKGVLEINLSELNSLWSENAKQERREEKEINIDMSKMYHFWRDETAIEIHWQEEKGFKSDRTKTFLKFLKKTLKVKEKLGKPDSADTEGNFEKSVFQAEYRIILFLLEQLDEYGHCSSVVDMLDRKNFKSGEPDDIKLKQNIYEILPVDVKTRLKKKPQTGGDNGDGKKSPEFEIPFKNSYEILKNVNLLDHSVNVAENIIKLICEDEDDEIYKNTMLPVAVIVALAHDIGKIPEYYTGVYNKLTHPLISATILHEFIEGSDQPIKKTLDKQIIEIMVEAVKNHHTTVSPQAATESRFKKIIEYLKKADTKARTQEVEKILKEYGALKDVNSAKDKKNMKKINDTEQKEESAKKDLKDAEETVEKMNEDDSDSESESDKENETEESEKKDEEHKQPYIPVNSPFVQTMNAFRNRLRNGSSEPEFKYPDFDKYTGFRPSSEEERDSAKILMSSYRDEILKDIPKWMELPEAVQTGIEIIEERINYCKPPKEPGKDPICGIYTVKGTVFVLSTVMMAVVYYVGDKLYNDNVAEKPYYHRGAYVFAYVNELRKTGLTDEQNMKFNYFTAPFTIFLTDFDGNPIGKRPGNFTPLSLSSVAQYFSKPMDSYEERKKNPTYCPDGYLLKLTGYKWGKG